MIMIIIEECVNAEKRSLGQYIKVPDGRMAK